MLIVDKFLPQPQEQLFNSFAFFRLHADACAYFYQWLQKDRVVMCLHLTETEPGRFRSPRSGTFAGVGFFADVHMQDIELFMQQVVEHIHKLGARHVEILLPPTAHLSARVEAQYFVLRALGFNEAAIDLNYALTVNARPLAERMNYANRKRYNKCLRSGMSAYQAQLNELPQLYAVIERNRASKGYLMSMTLHQLTEMAATFPEQLVLFSCVSEHRVAAAAVCLRLAPDVLYVFYWGDEVEFGQFSPITLLAGRIYEYCQQHAVTLLDIGTATLDGQSNHGLIRFKRALGCSESLKFKLEKHLES